MLTLFGRPSLTDSLGRRIEILPSGFRLLAALAAGPADGVPRTELAGLVLPSGKLSTLRKLVWDLRRALDAAGLELIEGDARRLRLSPDAPCDVRELRAPQSGRALREIYRGPFLDGAADVEHVQWQEWLAETREALRSAYVARATTLLESTDALWPTKVQEARHLLRHAPDHAEATRILMLRGAQVADGREIRVRFADLQENLRAAGSRPDTTTASFLHRLVGASQRELGAERATDVIDLPIVYVAAPSGDAPAPVARLTRSLLTDITIGLCRASVFRVVSCQDGPLPTNEPAPGGSGRSYYVVASSLIDHVLGPQVVFTLMSLPEREIIWTERVEASDRQTVAAYNLLTAGVLRSLVRRIRDVEIEAFRLVADPGAYASFLAGYSSLASLDLAKLREGRSHLRHSMSRSPDFAPTTSALARSYQLEWLVTGRGDAELLTRAREHSLHAIASDSLEARGFKALGFCNLYEKNYDTALENYTRAEQLNRHYADLIAEHANCMLHCGLVEASLDKIDYAMQLNPEYGDVYLWTKACGFFLQSRYAEVIETVGLMQDREPALRLLAATHALLGNMAEARTCRMEAMRVYPTMTIRGWTNIVALRDPQHIRHYSEGLAKAGFP